MASQDILGLQRLEALSTAASRLEGASDAGELFQRAVDLARAELGFTRAVILAIDRGTLTASTTDPLEHQPSDQLRRALLAAPLAVTPGTAEAEAVRDGRSRPRSHSLLAEQLGLDHYVFVRIGAQGTALALLVVDRSTRPVDRLDRAIVTGYAAVLSSALTTVILRVRLDEVTAELRHLTVSAQALLGEVRDAPPSLPTRHGNRLSFGTFEAVPVPADDLPVLTERERVVIELLAAGLSNREIAERLVVSPETVKTHVARILRKLRAGNRAEAVARFVQLRRG